MSEKDDWLDRQLHAVLKDMGDGPLDGVDHSVPAVCAYNQMMAGGRYDMGVAHLIMATGYAVSEGLEAHPPLKTERTMTDEQLKHLAFSMTWADLEVFLSQLGLTLWKALWRARR